MVATRNVNERESGEVGWVGMTPARERERKESGFGGSDANKRERKRERESRCDDGWEMGVDGGRQWALGLSVMMVGDE